MFYTDTNGHIPEKCSMALVVLAILMESVPLDEIDFEIFNAVAKDIDQYCEGLLTGE